MLRGSKVEAEERDLGKQPLTKAELKELFAGRPAAEFINPRNDEAKEKGWNKTPPSDDVLLAAMSKNPNLIRRPILMVGKQVLLGFNEKEYRDALK